MAQLPAPSLRCASVNSAGDVSLTWVIPSDPTNIFTQYDIYSAPVSTGPFNLIGSVTNYSQNIYTHIGAGANIQAKYYYVVTISSGTNSSSPSDTLRSIFLNLNNPGNGIASLTWNATRTPLLLSAANTYTLSREYPVGVWTNIYTGTGNLYKDTVSLCSVFYTYQIKTSDAFGCFSESNLPGSLLKDLTPPVIPLLDSISVNGGGLASLGWNPTSSADALGYVIYKMTGGAWIPIDTVYGINNTSYTNSGSLAGTTAEEYCIAAFDSCKNISPLGTSQKTIFLSGAFDLCARTANLSWSSYGNIPSGVLEYDIYCSVNGAAYNFLATTNSNTYTHTGLIPGKTYCYVVRVVNKPHQITASSNQTCINATSANGPAYIYIRSVSVTPDQKVQVSYWIEPGKAFKGVKLFRSEDGLNFSYIATNLSTAASASYQDANVKCREKNYYYRAEIIDSCGNDGAHSNTGKTVLLKVQNDNANIFYNQLSWDDYASWSGGVLIYNIYRAVDGVFNSTPVATVPFGTRNYTDNVQDFVSESGKFSYYVEAVEGLSNIYGLRDSARSNIADAYAEVTVFVPTAFAPKGLNNVWLPVAQYVEKTDYKVMVFNRWGDKVFETHSDTEGWSGSGATDDVYVYLIQYKNARGEFVELKGTFILLR